MIENYKIYLNHLDEHLQKIYAHQAPYLCCKKGCSLCCKTITPPLSAIEFEYVMQGFEKLDENTKAQININIKNIKNQSANKTCPFLINNACSVYNFRPIICRSHGLALQTNMGLGLPFCVHHGLNYANVYDSVTKTISSDKSNKIGAKNPPTVFKVSLDDLQNSVVAKNLDLQFGVNKPLTEYL